MFFLEEGQIFLLTTFNVSLMLPKGVAPSNRPTMIWSTYS